MQVRSEQTALLKVPLWHLGMLVRQVEGHLTQDGGHAVRLQRLCLKTENLQPSKQRYTLH